MLDLKRLETKVQKTLRVQGLSATTGVNILIKIVLDQLLSFKK
jgi:hypothetical protein